MMRPDAVMKLETALAERILSQRDKIITLFGIDMKKKYEVSRAHQGCTTVYFPSMNMIYKFNRDGDMINVRMKG